MSTAELTAVSDYVGNIMASAPAEAAKIALAEAQRQQALAEKAAADYRALAEVEFDGNGRIARANMAGLYRLAQAYARSQIVPEQYRGKPDDCFIACQMACRLKVDPMAYMQASYVVHGRPGLEAKLAIGLLNTSGLIRGRIQYKNSGSIEKGDRQCTAYATDAATGEIVSATVTWKMVVGEGWISKSGSKWKTMPDVMFVYRSAAFLIRQYYPEVLSGMPFADELEDISPSRANGQQPPRPATLNDLAARFGNDPSGAPSDSSSESGYTIEPATDTDAPANDEPEAPEPASAEATLRAELTAKLERAARFSADSLRKVRDEMCGPATRLDEAMREHAESEYQRLLPTAAPAPAKATRGKAAPAQGELLS